MGTTDCSVERRRGGGGEEAESMEGREGRERAGIRHCV